MHQMVRFSPAFLSLLFCLLCTSGRAQEAVISGQVTDTEGEALIGATVQVIGSVIGAATNLNGHYEIEVPPGNIRLLYSYLGFEDFDTTLVVGVAEREFGVDVTMSESFLETGEVIVFGRRASGQAQALRNQQSSQLNQTIIHSEVFNIYPDITIAETVSRMPGVSILRGVDEGEIVQMRGLPEQYTAVMLNGQRLPTIQPEVDQSGSLDIIQSNLVDEVRVIKARAADMDGDAIAGTVDFRVRHPEEKFEVLLQAGQGQNFGFNDNPNQSSGITQLAGTINSEVADEKVYALASGSYLRQGRGTSTQRYEYGSLGERGRNLYSSRPFDTDRQTERVGFVGAVELRPSIYNRMRLSYNFSELSEEIEERQLLVNAGDAPSVRRISSGWQTNRRLNLVAMEVENNFPKTRLDYQLSFSENSERLSDRLRNVYRADAINANINSEAALRDLLPNDVAAAGPLTRIAQLQDNSLLEETVAIGSLNITRYLNSKRNSFLKFGGRYRSKDRRYGTSNLLRQAASQPDEITAGTFPELLTEPFVQEVGSLDTLNKSYDAQQRIAAGYVMYAANFNAKLSLTTGLRYEYTTVEARNAVDTFNFNNNKIFPSLNLTYRIRRDRQFRFAYYDAVARPNYGTYRPLENTPLQLIANDQFSISNPDLEQTFSRNFDLTYERYGNRDGLLTIGLYGKFLNNPTVLVQTSREELTRPVYDNTIVNANDATVIGLELGFYQNLGFLNNKLRFIDINGTYNYNTIDVDNPDGVDDDLPLAQAPRQSANLSFVYSNPNTRLNFVAAANFRDRVFDRLLDGEAIYRNRLLTIDISADYEVFKNISIYLRANNLTDHEFEEWIGESDEEGSLKRQSSFYGRWGVVGLRFQPR
jgi:TonB-dependent receptor